MTGKVLTEKYKSQNAINFYENLNDDTYYVAASCINNPNGDVVNSVAAKNEFARRVIFGNKITRDDARFLFKKIPWENAKIYTQYDDVVDLTNRDYYVSILTGEVDEANYRIYKCINNNAGSPSVVSPSVVSFDELTDDGYFTTQDGYTWKYMFSVTPTEYTKYQTSNELPYREPTTPYTANDGIYNIMIEESSELALTLFAQHNLGECTILSSEQESGGLYSSRILVPTGTFVKAESNSYVGMYLEIDGAVYDIVGSSKPSNQTNNIVIIKTSINPNIQAQTKCFVKPKIIVSNSDTGGNTCIASGILDAFGRLVRVHFNSHGSGYTQATATLVLPPSLQEFTNLIKLRAIVSPENGHGASPIIELKMSKVGIVTSYVSTSTTNTPETNTYTQIGLIKDPVFNGDNPTPLTFDNRKVLICAGDITNTVETNKYVIQDKDEIVSAYIHNVEYDSDLNLTYISVVDYKGPAAQDITTGSALVNDTISTTNGVSFTINSIEDGAYVDSSGSLLHFVSFDPITRNVDNVEKIKLIFDF